MDNLVTYNIPSRYASIKLQYQQLSFRDLNSNKSIRKQLKHFQPHLKIVDDLLVLSLQSWHGCCISVDRNVLLSDLMYICYKLFLLIPNSKLRRSTKDYWYTKLMAGKFWNSSFFFLYLYFFLLSDHYSYFYLVISYI